MECVKVDLNKIFEKGQVYVVFSCVIMQEGLQVFNFNKIKVMVYLCVINFYNSLYGVDVVVKKKMGMLDDFVYQKLVVVVLVKLVLVKFVVVLVVIIQWWVFVYDDLDVDEEEVMVFFG